MKRKKLTRTSLKRKADELFSKIVRASGPCRKCGTYLSLQCAHIVSRSYLGTRWDRENAMPLCAGCHMYFTYHPLEWEAFVASRIGFEAYGELKLRALRYPGLINYEAITRELKEELAKREAA